MLTAALPLLALTAGVVPGSMPPLPGPGPSPLLFVRVSGPEGLHATFYTGRPHGSELPAPSVVGLRPGYIYRLKLSGLEHARWLELNPTLEVLGSLRLSPRVNTACFPAPVHFSAEDLEQALAGSMVTKVVYLEHPERAAPISTDCDTILEDELPYGHDFKTEAWDRGRPVLIVRLGGRALSEAELIHQGISGTVMLPGEKAISAACLPPCLPYAGWQFYDPILGPRPPEEECLHDGGDRGPRAGIDPDGNLVGLDPEDTVAEYTDCRGRRRVVCSNRVCLCTPRYAALRHVLPLNRYDTVVSVSDRRDVLAQQQMRLQTPSLLTAQHEELTALAGTAKASGTQITLGTAVLKQITVLEAQHIYLGLAAAIGTNEIRTLTERQRLDLLRQVEFALELSNASKPSGNEQWIGPAVVGRVEGGPQVVRATAETAELMCVCHEAPHELDKPLYLCKWCDRGAAVPGEVVEFTLHYTNRGGKPITDVAVSDSLTTRLEYVPGSEQSDRNAVFTVQENEAGSLVLHWEIGGRLLPGESGVVRFKAKVR
jgi:uncharacterized repeat protein (TIGR01451 family)